MSKYSTQFQTTSFEDEATFVMLFDEFPCPTGQGYLPGHSMSLPVGRVGRPLNWLYHLKIRLGETEVQRVE